MEAVLIRGSHALVVQLLCPEQGCHRKVGPSPPRADMRGPPTCTRVSSHATTTGFDATPSGPRPTAPKVILQPARALIRPGRALDNVAAISAFLTDPSSPAKRDPPPHTPPIHLIGFSKGCVVLNQIVVEASTAGARRRHVPAIVRMTWIDSGNGIPSRRPNLLTASAGGSGAYPVDATVMFLFLA